MEARWFSRTPFVILFPTWSADKCQPEGSQGREGLVVLRRAELCANEARMRSTLTFFAM